MDPMTVLSLAGTIVQFVDFGSKLISSSVELYRSKTGTLKINYELELIAAEVGEFASKISQGHGQGDNLNNICSQATDIAREIIERLEAIKVNGTHRKWESLRKAVQAAWRDDLPSLKARLFSLKSMLDTSVMQSLRETIEVMSVKTSSRFKSLDEQNQRIIIALLEQRKILDDSTPHEIRDQMEAISQILSRIEFQICDQSRKEERQKLRLEAGIVKTIQIVDLSQADEDKLRLAVEERILKTLRFKTMETRVGQIVEAHRKTFNWVFQEVPGQSVNWHNFVEWLSQGKPGKGIYWIKGKAGSGKSTLMKYIKQDPRTKKYLQDWAKSSPLHVAHFFFWNSSIQDQKSQHGLLRAVLYEILRQEPKLIPTTFPWLWAKVYNMFSILPGGPVDMNWSLSRLMEAFNLLIHQTSLPVKLCLFIDGLDEYDGDAFAIADLFKGISTLDNVKICVSSRPWPEFETAFDKFPQLRLQDLTQNDIAAYVTDKLINNDKFKQLAKDEPIATPELITEITEMASGVFLWVSIVVSSLLRGLQMKHPDNIKVLQKRLSVYPTELDDLYAHMFKLIEDVHRGRAAEIFQIVKAARVAKDHLPTMRRRSEPLSVVALNFAINREISFDTIQSLKPVDLKICSEEMEFHLNAHCAGLLESWDDKNGKCKQIHYLHRTAREFLESPAMWNKITGISAGSKFNPNTALVRSCHCRLLIREHGEDDEMALRIVEDATIFAYHANNQHDANSIQELDHLDRTMTQILRDQEHWTNRLTSAPVARTPLKHASLHTFTIQCDLSSYVEKITTAEEISGRANDEVNLLEYVVTRHSVTNSLPFSPRSASVLLKLGADPNRKRQGYSVWQKFLYVLYKHWPKRERNSADLLQVSAMIKAFLDHRANASAYIIVGELQKKPLSALQVITRTIGKTFPEETGTKEIVERLKSLGAKERLRTFQLLPTTLAREMRFYWLDPETI